MAKLFDHEMGTWKVEQIRAVLGEQAIQSIINTVHKPVSDPLIEDRLIWVASKQGVYTTAKGYKQMSSQQLIKP